METAEHYANVTDRRIADKIDAALASEPHAPPDDAVLLAIARVDQSLAVVLKAITEIQREIRMHQPNIPDGQYPPDNTWVGTP
jgi:hypothetical protein